MSQGILELRQVKQQVDFILDVAEDQDVIEQGEALSQTVDEWIASLLQKELKTSQNNYQYEARLFVKYKDLLGRIGGANIPVTEGVKEVTGDYLQIWSDLEAELRIIKGENIPEFNERLREAGLPLIYLPRRVS